MKKLLLVGLLALAPVGAWAADTTLAVTAGSGTTIVVSPDGSGNIVPHTIPCDHTTPTQCAAYDSSGNGAVRVNVWGGSTLGAASNYGTSPGAVLVPGVNAYITNVPAVSQSGTWSVNLGTLNGAATAALQTTGNTALTTINTTLGTPMQNSGGSVGISGTLPAFAATPTVNLGTIGTAATAANQTNASQKTQIVDGSGNVIASTSNNLNVQCANCSGSGVSTGDEASFTAGTSLFAGGGGFYQTTATNNPLTTGQQGMFQVTANRALFANLRNASGTEIGTSSTPLQVSVANTGANGTAIAVSAASLPLPTGAATAANQTTANTSLATIATNSAAAIPAGTNNIGTVNLGTSADPCANSLKSSAPINLTASGQIITGTSAKNTYICALHVISATAQNVALVEGTGSTCATNIYGLAGGTTAASGWNLAANGGLAEGSGGGTIIWGSADANVAAANLCLLLSGTGQTSGTIEYVQQ